MRRLLYFFCIGLLPFTGWGQSTDGQQGLSFKRSFIDYKSPNAGNFGDFKNYNSGFEVGYQRVVGPVEVYVPIRFGVIRLVDEIDRARRTFGELDAQVHYRLIKDKPINPYVLGGVGAVAEQLKEINLQIPVGAGVDFRIASSSYINLQAEFRLSLADQRNNLQISLGWKHYFGSTGTPKQPKKSEAVDSDGDGIPDDLDLCPQEPGLKAFAGCPDTDGDGIEDARDECPSIAGLKIMNGCPDSDGDGISDKDDECPNLAGIAANNGCPGKDRDNDGVVDEADECPDVAGSVMTKGCPDSDGDGIADAKDLCPDKAGTAPTGCPDSDGDGVDDSMDKCPDQPGPATNKGCPELKKEEKEYLRVAMRDVKFQHNKATLLPESFRILDQIVGLMQQYPGYNLKIHGYTDNTGSLSINRILSERRAKACYDYIISKGVISKRVSFQGFGPANPVADNNTQEGRALNRRVEFEMIVE
ncbi:MAG TPA: thrombospondin type 3 repeat-containing protein [Saprospiraceae bacterium]|nr:OmpA family protein [Saprospiraceae bacterium]HPG05666.1 thrombospondin type 3 repeat-containing protein [Saprospiraceae bacterium]HPQ99220.1 thrombospondin type 3 repeat-containing protein [Saprospiraceae bacterium]HQU55108.1 thrombospondin type 3 repeat-containing protein [Saprospiraceae bacterium]HRV83301.1 thrombospondin type 3 repeat-containing protein [Saprospiraceae bacterium]